MGIAALDFYLRPEEKCVAVARELNLIQRRRGNAFSIDDLLVGYWACRLELAWGEPARILDLGCGIGSVLLLMAWRYREALLTGLEAQEESVSMACRNVLLNGFEDRIALHPGDLRDRSLLFRVGTFDLVTGTPPYFDPKAATPCSDLQRAHARFELRGGIEEYAQAASQVLSERGVLVACGPGQPAGRTRHAIESAGLFLNRSQLVLPREDKKAYLELVLASKVPSGECLELSPLVLRHLDGRRSKEHMEVQSWFGVSGSEM